MLCKKVPLYYIFIFISLDVRESVGKVKVVAKKDIPKHDFFNLKEVFFKSLISWVCGAKRFFFFFMCRLRGGNWRTLGRHVLQKCLGEHV